MEYTRIDDPIVVAATRAIHEGDADALRRLLARHPRLATARLGDPGGTSRTLLHTVTDWPGHFPGGPRTVAVLVAAGADVDARFEGPHTETPLHWAASSGDVPVLDALLDHGADIEATGAVIAGGTPVSDACAFGQWEAAHRLVERGASTSLWESAALGLMDRVTAHFAPGSAPAVEDVTRALWSACHGGRRESAQFLLDRGGDVNWVGYDDLTPLDAALRGGFDDLAGRLRAAGARSNR